MKIKFDPNPDFQLEAIQSVVDVFKGQEQWDTDSAIPAVNRQKGGISAMPGAVMNDLGAGKPRIITTKARLDGAAWQP